VMQPYSLEHLYRNMSKITKDIVLYLPRNSNLNQVGKYAEDDGCLEVVHYCLEGSSKAIVAYYGNFRMITSNVR